MAALVAAALAGIGDAPARLAAILSDRYRRPGAVILAAAVALAAASALAVVAGMLLAPMMTPEARLLMLALALVLQGGGALFPAKVPDRLERWRLGAFVTSVLGLFILLFGDGIQFVVVALAARASVPWLAAVGATMGSLAVIAPAAMLGEAAWMRLPLKPGRLAIAILFLVTGIVIGVQALALA
ncbi:Putative Ca2+/H+ antiporter, TMEM165/GDT1 family [Sphingomonas gellani]|uniref:GDT1 family protein n=2 Tax=Sphingomonas gellani TaxID=1166340 RepID=A0A1H8IZL6_9SPHN|nr:Putative Ca2+/H+ antiporter, TMEM165/GDT1 family [Sphingomonas gellani]